MNFKFLLHKKYRCPCQAELQLPPCNAYQFISRNKGLIYIINTYSAYIEYRTIFIFGPIISGEPGLWGLISKTNDPPISVNTVNKEVVEEVELTGLGKTLENAVAEFKIVKSLPKRFKRGLWNFLKVLAVIPKKYDALPFIFSMIAFFVFRKGTNYLRHHTYVTIPTSPYLRHHTYVTIVTP